ncbi:hypothetical protein FB474_0088 [Oryzihumus leptocrescens]|uniref:Uncharacterized protein n=1 Tax=Oryzihumus leptocrescens TaxID=297536 RepID=A0A542ZEM5_9MICO|nr:hypothetical protein FB474_0088 [Oryzihumus leptocrescens]
MSPGITEPSDPYRYAFWEESDGPDFALRVAVRLYLPRRAAQRPWLTTAAQEALLTALDESALPLRVWASSASGVPERPAWKIENARSSWVRARAVNNPVEPHLSNLTASAYLGHLGGHLYLLLDLAARNPTGHDKAKVGIESLHEGLIALLTAGTVTLQAVADALDVGDVTRLGITQGWLLSPSQRLTEALDLPDHVRRHTDPGNHAGFFSPLIPGGRSPEDLDDLAKVWITTFLLDESVAGFEDDLLKAPLPRWVGA